jgi:monoamine oxidase
MDGENYKYSPYRYVDLQDVREKYPDNGTEQWREALKRVFEYPHPLLVPMQSEHPKKVCIIGGGIAGLTAAYELVSRNNVTVTLLEATNRFGGRIWTHRFPDGTYGELGAMRIPVIHGCVCHYVKKFKLKYRRFVDRNIDALFYLRGGPPVKQVNWRDLLAKYSFPYEHEQVQAHASNPMSHFAGLMAEYDPGVTIISKLEPLLRDFVIPRGVLDLFEHMSLGQILRRTPRSFQNVSALSSDAYEYLGRANGTLWLERASFLQFWLNELPLKEPNKIELVGGMGTLVDAFVHEINDTGWAIMSKDARVKGVRLIPNENKVKVIWESKYADHLSEKFDYVICTVPAQPTTNIEFDPPLQSPKYEALTNLSYCSAAKTIVHCNRRHWELVDMIYGGGSFTDLSIQQCWYPSDNSRKAKRDIGSAGEVGSADEITPAGKRAQVRWRAADPNKSKQPGVFTASYTWEANARRFAAMSEDQRNRVVLSDLRKLHPGIEHVIDDMVHCVWDTEANPGHGAFAFFAPGEQRRYQAALCQPWPSNQDGEARVFFAGEHVAIMHAWIQSAMQSALTAVMNILEAPS